MSAINEGFVDDESKEVGLVSRSSPDSSNEITRAEAPVAIDYSKASSGPIFLAAFAGNKCIFFYIISARIIRLFFLSHSKLLSPLTFSALYLVGLLPFSLNYNKTALWFQSLIQTVSGTSI